MLTKFSVEESLLAEVVAPVGRLRYAETLEGGYFASALRLHFADGRRAVAKIVGADDSRFFTYERGLLGTEALVYRCLAGSNVPVPAVLYTDFSRAVIDADVVVAEHVKGVPWLSLSLDRAQVRVVRRNLGAMIADLHRMHGDSFGYPAPEAGLSGLSWPGVFRRMIEAVLDDARRWAVMMPVDRVRAAVARHHSALTAVTRPVVVHADLWEGNIFLDEDSLDITGIIDAERTVCGDPLYELIGADQFGSGAPDPDLLAGNAAAGGVLGRELSSSSGEARLQLYRLYFSLILAAERTIRGYDAAWGMEYERSARDNVDRALRRLEALDPLS